MSIVAQYNKELALAAQAAREAGDLLLKGANSLTPDKILYKSAIDLVTQYDKESEELILSVLHRSGIPVLAEESHSAIQLNTTQWIVDPLDGTTNFAHSFPHYSISIALQVDGVVVLGVIFNPCTNELFTAHKGMGSFCNEAVLQCQDAHLSKALLLTGFPYDRRERSSFYLRYFRHFLERCRGLRRPGSAALDLAYIAAGRANGFWEFGLQPWDVAAGLLLVEEAGGKTSNLYGEALSLGSPHFLAAAPQLHQQMITEFRKLEVSSCKTS